MTDPHYSIVVPAYNEESRLERSIQKIHSYLESRLEAFEIIIVDDGSTDSTGEIAKACSEKFAPEQVIRVIQNPENRGKGFSVRRGMLEARGALALLTDADLSTPMDEIGKLEEKVVGEGYDIAIGSRDVPGAEIIRHQPWFRERAGKIFNDFVQALTSLPFRDTQCGFKLFRMEKCREIFKKQRITRYAFDVEVLFVAQCWGLKLAEVPVKWRHAEGSKVHLFPDAFLTGIDLARIRWNQVRGLYRQ